MLGFKRLCLFEILDYIDANRVAERGSALDAKSLALTRWGSSPQSSLGGKNSLRIPITN